MAKIGNRKVSVATMSTKTHETELIKFSSVFYLPSFVACHKQNGPRLDPTAGSKRAAQK